MCKIFYVFANLPLLKSKPQSERSRAEQCEEKHKNRRSGFVFIQVKPVLIERTRRSLARTLNFLFCYLQPRLSRVATFLSISNACHH